MNRKYLILVLFSGLLLLVAFRLFYTPDSQHEPRSAIVCFGKTCVNAEIADEPAKQMQGLMYRDTLKEGDGMLFVFPTENPYAFWMKNMKIPIDIIWIDKDRRIVHIAADVPPCTIDPCPSYAPKNSAKYVLEVPANFTKNKGIKEGDVCKIIIEQSSR